MSTMLDSVLFLGSRRSGDIVIDMDVSIAGSGSEAISALERSPRLGRGGLSIGSGRDSPSLARLALRSLMQ